MVKRRGIRIPTETFNNDLLKDTVRKFPSLDCLTAKERKEVEKRTRDLMYFESVTRTPMRVADFLSEQLTRRGGFEEYDIQQSTKSSRKTKYFFRDPWDQESMIIVKEGQSPITEGCNVIMCHSDSPCLRIKPRPLKLEWDEDEIYNYLGVRLSAVPHGGIVTHQWMGQQVTVTGYHVDKKGHRRHIEFPGIVADTSAHIDYREEQEVKDAFAPERSLEIIIGQTTLKETLESLEFKSLDDFALSKLFAVPTNNPLPIDEYTWRLLCSYGHDNKVGVFSAIDAIRKARKPKRTAIIWITNNEEVGDVAPTGQEGSFFNLALDYMLEKHTDTRGDPVEDVEKRQIYMQSSLIYADVNIAPYGHDAENMDVLNAPKLGFGVSIAADPASVSHLDFLRKIRNLTERGATSGHNICHQIVGEVYHQDREPIWNYESAVKGRVYAQFGQWLSNVGIPCAGMHSPNEIICPGDEYWTSRLYRRFLESNVGLREENGRN